MHKHQKGYILVAVSMCLLLVSALTALSIKQAQSSMSQASSFMQDWKIDTAATYKLNFIEKLGDYATMDERFWSDGWTSRTPYADVGVTTKHRVYTLDKSVFMFRNEHEYDVRTSGNYSMEASVAASSFNSDADVTEKHTISFPKGAIAVYDQCIADGYIHEVTSAPKKGAVIYHERYGEGPAVICCGNTNYEHVTELDSTFDENPNNTLSACMINQGVPVAHKKFIYLN